MAFNRIDGAENLYVSGIFPLRKPGALAEQGITHIVSALGLRPPELSADGSTPWRTVGEQFKHLVIDVDDVDDEDLLVHFPKAVRFIEEGLYPQAGADGEGVEGRPTGGVLVHCAMGKSRSVSVVVAYLLWKHPQRFGRSAASAADPDSRKGGAREAVKGAVEWVRRSRGMADPNWGFRSQLQLWWEMGCPEDVEAHPTYRRWAYKREIELSVAAGMAPELKFEDEMAGEEAVTGAGPVGGSAVTSPGSSGGPELRCRKCRATLAKSAFIVSLNHTPPPPDATPQVEGYSEPPPPPPPPCQHYFVEPLSWMRPTLEMAELEGRLACPGPRCGASVGRYSWKGFPCSCGEWVTPAFSLQKSRVDVAAARTTRPAASLGIRMPPGMRVEVGAGDVGAPKENL